MSMTTAVEGIKPPNEKWKKMKAIWDACRAADIDIPKEVDKFFDGEEPDSKGVVVSIPHEKYFENGREGFEIYLDKIPKDIKIIRFFNSW